MGWVSASCRVSEPNCESLASAFGRRTSWSLACTEALKLTCGSSPARACGMASWAARLAAPALRNTGSLSSAWP